MLILKEEYFYINTLRIYEYTFLLSNLPLVLNGKTSTDIYFFTFPTAVAYESSRNIIQFLYEKMRRSLLLVVI